MRCTKLSGLAGALLGAALALATGILPALAADYTWPRYFGVVTPVVGTGNHSLAVAWTSVFSERTGARARVLPAPNGYTRAAWLNTGEGRLSMFQASDYFDQMDGVRGYASKDAGPTDTRVVHVNMVTAWGYMVRGDSKIKSIDDIGPGTRVAFAPSSSFLVAGIDALLAYRGLSREDVEIIEVGGYVANTKVVVEGRADVTFTSPLSGPSYEAEASPYGIRWLELPERKDNPAAYDRYRALQPGYIPMPTTAGVKSAIGLRMDHAFQTNHAKAEDDPEFVYQLVKWLDENHEHYKGKFAHANMLTVDNLVRFLEVGALQPLHEGTIRYLKEKGLWKPEYQKRQDQLVQLAQKHVQAFQGALRAAAEAGIDPTPGNESWHAFWAEYRKRHGITRTFGESVLAL